MNLDTNGELVSGAKVVAASGTPEPLAASGRPIVEGTLVVTPLPGNTGAVYIGGPETDATATPPTGVAILHDVPNPVMVPVFDLSKVFVDAANNGEGISYFFREP